MKSEFQIIRYLFLGFFSVIIFVGCAEKRPFDGGTQPVVGRSPDSSSDPSETTVSHGTSDSGGGTGVDGKVFESYVVDPSQLPAYKLHLEKLLKNIQSKNVEESHPEDIFKIKTWYIAPIELDKIHKDVLGLSFVKSETEQIARQSMKEVWIDKRLFDKMTTQEQAELILHELVMSLYLVKFMTVSEICRLGVVTKSGSGCSGSVDLFDKLTPPEKAHPLTVEDNENIRFVTGWLLRNATKPVPHDDFTKILYFKGFDKRFYRPSDGEGLMNPNGELKISRKELFQAVKGAELVGYMPDTCFVGGSKSSKPCQVEISEKMMSFGVASLPGFNLKFSAQDVPAVDVGIFTGDEVTLSGSRDIGDNSILYSYVFVENRSKVQFGDRLYSGFFIFRKDGSSPRAPLILESVLLKVGVVVAVDKNHEPYCKVRTPKATHLFEEDLIIRRKDAAATVTEEMLASLLPIAACSASNVTE